MALSNFNVVHERGGTFDDPLVHCYAGRQLVLTYVSLEALRDYFHVPGDVRITLRQWNLVVDRNLGAFKPIIEAKFARDEWDFHNAYGQSYPKLVVTLEDMRRSGEEFTIDVLGLDAQFRHRPG